MTNKSLEQYLEALQSDAELSQELSNLLEGGSGEQSLSVTEFTELAAKHGFDIAEEDLAAADTEELSEAELDAIAGGAGKEFNYYTIELINASISGLRDKLNIRLINATIRR